MSAARRHVLDVVLYAVQVLLSERVLVKLVLEGGESVQRILRHDNATAVLSVGSRGGWTESAACCRCSRCARQIQSKAVIS